MVSKLSVFRKVDLINFNLSLLAGIRSALELEFVAQSFSNKEEVKGNTSINFFRIDVSL